IVFENANVIEVDPRDDEAITRLNDSAEAKLVTVKDRIDLPMIAAFRLLAAKLQSRHPILLKDILNRGEQMLDAGYSILDNKRSPGSEIEHRVSSIQDLSDFLTT